MLASVKMTTVRTVGVPLFQSAGIVSTTVTDQKGLAAVLYDESDNKRRLTYLETGQRQQAGE